MNSIDMEERRKKLLFSIDNNEEISNCQKGFVGLTTYYDFTKTGKLNQSLYEKILYSQDKENHIKHIDGNYNFMPKQVEVYEKLKIYDRILISAPTSFGKSLLVKEYIYNENLNFIVYIVPTNSLAYELEQEYKKNPKFNRYEIFDSWKSNDENDNHEKGKIFIGTQEKFNEISIKINQKIDLFIIDEAYKLKEKSEEKRSYILSKSFIEAIKNDSRKIILLSPNGKFKGFLEYGFKMIDVKFNCVEKSFEEYEEKDYYKLISQESKENKTLVFCKSPSNIEKIYDGIKNVSNENKIRPFEEIKKLILELEEEVHPEWNVLKCLKQNILVHHGQMPKYLQNKILNLFNNREAEFNLLIGTKSISEGINTPTKTIIIDMNYKFNNNEKLLIKNTIGRAGRLNQYPIGKVFSVTNKDQPLQEYIKDIEIELAISDELEKINYDENHIEEKILKITSDDEKKEKIRNLLKKHSIKVSTFEIFVEEIKEDFKYNNYTNITYFSKKILKNDYKSDIADDIKYLKGLFNKQYQYDDTYASRIKFYRDQKNSKEKTNSEIIDGYMRMQYSILEYKYIPIVNLYFDCVNEGVLEEVGLNVDQSFKEFRQRYATKIRKFTDYDKLSKDGQMIFDRLRDLGVNTYKIGINEHIINEIEKEMGTRYSMYDIEQTIRKLSNKNIKNSGKYKQIINKYFT